MKLNFTIPSLPILLSIIFMILKLCGVIAWSWFWVIFPVILPLIICMCVFIVFVILTILFQLIKIINKK